MQIRRLVFIVFMGMVVSYFFFEARSLLFKPQLVIYEPVSGDIVSLSVRVAGYSNTNGIIKVAGKILNPNENGIFEGTIVLNPGYHRIGFVAQDHLGNETQKIIQVVAQ